MSHQLLWVCALIVSLEATPLVWDVRCLGLEDTFPGCINRTHHAVGSCMSGDLSAHTAHPCDAGFECQPSTGACTADQISSHMRKSVDFQIVETVDADEVSRCKDPVTDAAQGRMLCEVLAATAATQPTFGHSLGNTWLSAPSTGNGTIDGCSFSSPAAWRSCIGANIAKQAALLVKRSPHLMLCAGLMEFLSKYNLDHPEQFETECCQAGSMGQWGRNDTCVPDIRTKCIQDYYIAWGKVFLDAGIRAFFFGQSRLTGGGRTCNDDGTGCSRVSIQGAQGFATVIQELKAYARQRDLGPVFFGPQAASGFELADGTELANWAYGTQKIHFV